MSLYICGVNQKKRENIFQYLQVLALGLILVFSPCSVRNSLQDALNLEQTGITNVSKTTPTSFETCSSLTINADEYQTGKIINTTPSFDVKQLKFEAYDFNTGLLKDKEDPLNRYQAPSTVKNKIPLYLLHQQFKTYLIS